MFSTKKIVFFFLYLVWCHLGLGQNKTSIKENRLTENIHLQLNKTIFFEGENLWFKAYIQDQRLQLPSSSTNLHVGIFSKEGNVLKEKMFLVSNGICKGDFKIDSTFVDDSYTVIAWTNYMKNFESSVPYVQKINIIGKTKQVKTTPQKSITILIRPEGQNIIPNTFNKVGFMVFDEQLSPIKTSDIKLVDEKGNIIQSNIKTNKFGHGRFSFYAEKQKNYTLRIKGENGKQISKKIVNMHNDESAITVNNSVKDFIIITLKTKKTDLNSKQNKRLKLAFFNNEGISYITNYTFNQNTFALSIERNKIPYGINTVVILDVNNKAISKRTFFNTQDSSKRVYGIKINYSLTENKDSLKLSLVLPKGHRTADLSMSVLPGESIAYSPNNSIISSFLLQPYIKQQLADGQYYFEGKKRSKDFQLDTRLLFEEENRFRVNSGSENYEKLPYKKEKYVAFTGKILDADITKESMVSIIPNLYKDIKLFELSSNKNFKGNMVLFKDDTVQISVLNYKGKLRKPKAELYVDNNDKDFDYKNWLSRDKYSARTVNKLATNTEFDLMSGVTALDEVIVSEKTKKTKKFQIDPYIEGIVIDKETANKYSSLLTYIRRLGFQTRQNTKQGGVSFYIINNGVSYPVPVSINGMAVSPGEIIGMPLSSIKTIVYNRRLTAIAGPFISLSLRYDFDEFKGNTQFTKLYIPKGFSLTQTYFSPNYPNFTSSLYKKYGAIWWEGNIEVNPQTKNSTIVPLNGQKEVKIIIEGMSSNGFLYHTEQICKPYQN
ncbi:hypothetical protein [uncultured Winogradskyella sp.]|uniref:hypothetical protein n=1 Tax=uncultured Winogradskyella sp. TaxID=395353 RepID=UPI002634B02D|nr:hypothetical protein [uncultured Winogradskyella sp.]